MSSLRDQFILHDHFSAVETVYHKLSAAGYLVYLTGGCVRDALLQMPIGDFDLATDATPEQIEGLFEKTIAVGKEFGIIMVPFSWGVLEVASFRSDGYYSDGRRPENVTLSNPKEDSKRRDFTINALFYDLKTDRVVDYVEGQKDLALKVIRTVGNPQDRFAEDHLRILRAFRFVGQLDFILENETFKAALALKEKVTTVSRERIRDELDKTLKGKKREKSLQLMHEHDLFDLLLPDLPIDDLLFADMLAALSEVGKQDLLQSWLGFFVPFFVREKITETIFRQALKSLKFSGKEEKLFLKIHKLLSADGKFEALKWSEQAQELSPEFIRQAFQLAVQLDAKKYSFYPKLERKLKLQFGENVTLPQAFLSGGDLLALGVSAGPQMGSLLKELYDKQLEGKIASRDDALEIVKKNNFLNLK